MPDLLPDIPGDTYYPWAANQFMQSAQSMISSIPGDIATGVQNTLAPPPASPPLAEPPPAPEPAPEPAPPPAPLPPPPEPPPAPSPPAAPVPAPPADQSAPLPTDPISAALNAAQASGADMQQFGTTLNQHLSSGMGLMQAGLNAAQSAGADVQQFGSSLGSALPPPPPAPPPPDPGMGAAVNTPQQAGMAQDAWSGSVPVEAQRQFEQEAGLSSADAYTACGPVAAVAFAQTYGRNPTPSEAIQLAQQVGWDPSTGMAGPGSEVALLNKMGVDAHMTQGVDWSNVQQSAQSGNPVILNTPNHYLYVDGYNAQTGQYHVGQSGLALRGGSDWMTPDQIAQVPGTHGAATSAIYVDHPLGNGNPVTDILGQGAQNLGQSLGLQGPQSQQPGDLIDVARQAAQAAGIDPEIFTRQIQQESGFNPNAKSGAGALGIAQFMPGTAQGLGIDPTNPVQALQAAALMDAQNLAKYGGDWAKTLAAYNAGGGNVDKYGGVPPFGETQTYVQNILGGAQNAVQQLGQGAQSLGQNAQNALSGIQQTAQDLVGGAQSQLDPLSQQLLSTAQNVSQLPQSALAQLDPLSQQLLSDISSYTPPPSSQFQANTASPEVQQALSDILSYTPPPSAQFQANTANPEASQQASDQFLNMLQTPGGIKDALATTLENTGDIPGLPGSSLLLDLAAGMLRGPSVLDNMQTLGDMYTKYGGVPNSDQMTPEDRQAYQQAQLGIVAATLPGGEETAPGRAERVLNEAGQVLSTSGAPMGQMYGRTTGADLLSRAADALSQYPEDIQQQVLSLASKTNPSDSSQLASQIFNWIQQNPLEGGITNEARQVLQAVEDSGVPTSITGKLAQVAADNGVDVSASTTPSDIIDALQSRARGGNLPSGEMPGQLGLDLGDLTRAQPILPEGEGGAGVPATGLSSSDRSWLQQIQAAVDARDMQGLQTTLEQSGLLGERTSAVEGMLPGFEQGAQRALPEGAGVAGVPRGGLSGAETDWLSQLRQASAQRDFAGMADALQRAGLVGGDYRTGTYIPSDIRYDSGGVNQMRLQGVLPGMSNVDVRPPVEKPAALARPSGNLLSRLGQLVASAFSPTENLPAAARGPIQRFANMVGRQSDAISLMAHNLARDNAWDPQIEQSVRSQLYQKATRALIDELQNAELAAPRASAPSGWKTGSSSANSTLSNYAFHPDVASAIRAVVDQSGVATNPLASSVMRAANTAKGTIFSLSNFHTLTEGLNAAFSGPRVLSNYARAFASDNFANGLRGSMAQTFEQAARSGVTGLNLNAENADAAGQLGKALWRRVTAGTVGSVGGAASGYTEAKVTGKSDDEARNQAIMGGLAGASLAGVPLLRGRTTVAEALQSALWNRAVPIAKVTAWDGLTKGGLDPQVAANVVNERFGGLNYAAMGRNPAFMDATRMLIMAPDWGESTLRQLGSAIGGGAGQGARAGFLAKTLAGTMAVTELANYAMTGHATNDNQAGHQFEIEIQDPAGGYMHVGILPGNIQSVLSESNKIYADSSAKRAADFQNLVTNRLSAPFQVAGTALQAATARNSLSMPYGVSKAGPAALLANLSPIGISQVAQGVSSGGIDPKVAAVMALLGVNPRYTNPTSPSGTTPGLRSSGPLQPMPLAPAGGKLTPAAPLRPLTR